MPIIRNVASQRHGAACIGSADRKATTSLSPGRMPVLLGNSAAIEAQQTGVRGLETGCKRSRASRETRHAREACPRSTGTAKLAARAGCRLPCPVARTYRVAAACASYDRAPRAHRPAQRSCEKNFLRDPHLARRGDGCPQALTDERLAHDGLHVDWFCISLYVVRR